MNEKLIKLAEELEAELRKAKPPKASLHYEAAINCAITTQQHLKYDAEIAGQQAEPISQKSAK